MKVTLQNGWFDGALLWDRGTHEMDERVRDILPPSAEIEGEKKPKSVEPKPGASKAEVKVEDKKTKLEL